MLKLIVGLGNPGILYENTRHNIGWKVIDNLAEKIGASKFKKEKSVEVADAIYENKKIILVKPQTYMNLSGEAINKWLMWKNEIKEKVNNEKNTWENLLVVADDVNLPLGKIRVRAGGSSGGQNGLANIQKAFQTNEYPRMRLGVGEPPKYMDLADYVLAKFNENEISYVKKMVDVATDASCAWIKDGISKTQTVYNGG